jgi:hypothetical protein
MRGEERDLEEGGEGGGGRVRGAAVPAPQVARLHFLPPFPRQLPSRAQRRGCVRSDWWAVRAGSGGRGRASEEGSSTRGVALRPRARTPPHPRLSSLAPPCSRVRLGRRAREETSRTVRR